MYEIFEKLCDLHGVTPYKIYKETGIARSTLSDWKNGKSTPKQDKLKLIADFFNVSVDYLMTGEETRFTVEQANIDVQLARQQKRIKEYMLKFANLSDEKRNQIMSLIDMLEEK